MPRTKKITQNKKGRTVAQEKAIETSGIQAEVFDTKGKRAGTIELPKSIFAAKINDRLMAQAVRVYLANQRAGSASTKSRGEVKGSSRKIYRQKGTGRARHGSIRAPIFVHGGVAHGPRPRDFSMRLPKNMRRKALFSALSQKLKDGHIKIVAGLEKINPKTKEMVLILHNLEFNTTDKNILLVMPSVHGEMANILRSVRNIEGVLYTPALLLNPYVVIRAKHIIVMKDAISSIESTFGQKENV